ncbi:MAG: tetratricopeptide repeat protein [Parachlamydia sp.]|nr:tetratricopeptide repeat protein [Parachlamydia sp.]
MNILCCCMGKEDSDQNSDHLREPLRKTSNSSYQTSHKAAQVAKGKWQSRPNSQMASDVLPASPTNVKKPTASAPTPLMGPKMERVISQLAPHLKPNENEKMIAPPEESDEQVDSTSQVLNLHAKIAMDQGKCAAALELSQKALAMRVARFGEFGRKSLRSLPYEISCYGRIIDALGELRKFNEMLPVLLKKLEALKILHGNENHEEIGKTVNSIGMLHHAFKNYELAYQFFLRGAKIHAAIYGDEHAYIADNYKWLGMTLAAQDNFEDAWDYMIRSLKMRVKIHGSQHQATKESFIELTKLCLLIYAKPLCQVTFDQILVFMQEKYPSEEPAMSASVIIDFLNAANNKQLVEYYQNKLEQENG